MSKRNMIWLAVVVAAAVIAWLAVGIVAGLIVAAVMLAVSLLPLPLGVALARWSR